MADYSHLKKLDVNEQTTAEYIFEDIPGEPSIIFAPMTDSNPDYLNERVRIAVERAEADQANTKAKRREKILSSARLDEEREIDRELMARTCAKGWGNPPKDEKGKTKNEQRGRGGEGRKIPCSKSGERGAKAAS